MATTRGLSVAQGWRDRLQRTVRHHCYGLERPTRPDEQGFARVEHSYPRYGRTRTRRDREAVRLVPPHAVINTKLTMSR